MSTQMVFCIGAERAEMVEIERMVVSAGHRVCHAMAGGKRCHPGNAYVADDFSDGIAWGAVDVLVECDGIPQAIIRNHVVRIDHGQPGGSIEQVRALLGVHATQEYT